MHMVSQDKIKRNKDSGSPLMRYRKSFFNALNGIKYVFINEHNIPIILIAAIFTITIGILFNISTYEWLFCIFSIGAVTASEMINSAIEAVVDLVTFEKHPLAKIAKDSAAAATLIFSITAFVGALLIFIPKIISI